MTRGSLRNGLPMLRLLAGVLMALLLPLAALAAAAEAQSEAQRERARLLASELRCLVCQNQTIADSTAGLALDLRRQSEEKIVAGQTDDQIRAYMAERYGDFILYDPPFKASTA